MVSFRDLTWLRKGAVFRLWIRWAWPAWIFGLAWLLTMLLVLPSVLTPTSAAVLPLSWILGSVVLAGLCLWRVRPAVESARSQSRLYEHAAAAVGRAPREVITILEKAADYAVDAGREYELRQRIAVLSPKEPLRTNPGRPAPLAASDDPGEDPGEVTPSESEPKKPAAVVRPVPTNPSTPAPAAPAIVVAPLPPVVSPDNSDFRRIGVRGRYRLEAEIGRGPAGIIWQAFDMVLERKVSVRELPPTSDPGLRDRYRQEANALVRLSHPRIVAVYDFIEDEDETLFLAMEHVDGGDLVSQLSRPMPLHRGLELGRQLASALGVAHKRGIVHRHVLPANVLLSRDGNAKLTNFGLLAPEESDDPAYAAPEQTQGMPGDAQSDVYGFGATLFRMVAGAAPNGALASSLNSAVPPAFDLLLAQLLEEDPLARPPDLEEVAVQLAAIRVA